VKNQYSPADGQMIK